MRKKGSIIEILAVVIILGIFILNSIWIHINVNTPFYDNAGHTIKAAIFANIYNGVFEKPSGDPLLLKVSNYYPPFMYYISSVVLLLFDYQYKSLQYFSNLFLLLSTGFLYLWVKEFSGSRKTAALAAVFFILMPHIWEQARHFMLDLPLTTFIIASLYFLTKYRNLKKDRFLLGFLLFAAIAQLTKWHAFLYLGPPALYIFYQIIKLRGINSLFTFKNVFLLSAALIITLSWYLANFDNLFRQIAFFSRPEVGDPVNMLSLRNITLYPVLMFNYQVISVQFVLFLVSVYLVFKSDNRFGKFLVIYFFALLLVFIFAIGNKNLRYLMPLLPIAAIVMAMGLGKIGSYFSKASTPVFVVIVIFSLLFYGINSFSFPVRVNNNFHFKLLNNMDALYLADLTSNAVPYHWKSIPEVQKDIVNYLTSSEEEETDVLLVANNPYVSVAGLELFAIKDRFVKHFVYFWEIGFDTANLLQREDLDEYLAKYEYLITLQEYHDPIGQYNIKNIGTIKEYVLSGATRDYELVETFYHKEAGDIYLLKKNKDANKLKVEVSENRLRLERKPAVANIYLQRRFVDKRWEQTEILYFENEFEVDLFGVDVVRIDYPPELIDYQENPVWKYDGDKQFDRIAT
jgi:4-amino-4-deoxy-L-arabinose transferase-like glycosyltransferase